MKIEFVLKVVAAKFQKRTIEIKLKVLIGLTFNFFSNRDHIEQQIVGCVGNFFRHWGIHSKPRMGCCYKVGENLDFTPPPKETY